MDVTCPRCATEYEFEESRVPAEGVTVKCTSCGHVFRVKKVINAPQPESTLPPAPPPREWKVRQPNGNVFEFKELTTLQKWIVERKVGRDDEISLLGDSWKRLGNISELASFFQVVDDARRGEQLASLQPPTPVPPASLVSPPVPPRPSAPPAAPSKAPGRPPSPKLELPPPTFEAPKSLDPLKETLRQPSFSAPPPPDPVPRLENVTLRDKDFAPPPPPADDSSRFGALPKVAPPEKSPRQAPRAAAPADDWEPPKQSGAGRWIGALLVLAGLGGGVGYYLAVYAPEQERARLAAEAQAQQAKDAEATRVRAEEERAAQEQARQVAAAAEEAAAKAKAQADAEAAAAAAKAKAEEEAAAAAKVVDAGPPTKVARVPRDFDGLLAQADRLRERDRPEAAMDLYGAAADLQPERVEPLAGRGLALLDMGSTLQAEASFEQALKLNARYAPALMGMAEALKAQGKKTKAVDFYERYLEVMPSGSEAEVARKNVKLLKGEAP